MRPGAISKRLASIGLVAVALGMLLGSSGALAVGEGADRPSDDAVAVATGAVQSCVITTENGAKCWGGNTDGELGDGTQTNRSVPVDVVGLDTGVEAITAGEDNTCALLVGGTVKCWGWNMYGQVGDGTTTTRLTPVDVTGLTGVVAIAAGGNHTCAGTDAGGVKCWGSNQSGQLGDGTTTDRHTPVDVVGQGGVSLITAGHSHTCSVNVSQAWCWGGNSHGQLGDGTTTQRLVPVEVVGLDNGVTAMAGGIGHTCAVTSTG